MSQLLRVKDLKVSFHTYAGEVQAVRGITFEVDKGESLAIVGESGCGKTVTSKSIMGLISKPSGEIKKDSEIWFENQQILNYTEKQWESYRGVQAGMIFQDPMTSLNPTMKVGAQIAEGLIKHRNFKTADAMKEALRLLEIVGIPKASDRINQYPHQFSGGMRQRVVIAIALACNPKLLIADEPTTALDVTIQAQILDLLKDIQREFGTAIVLITHDLGVVAGIAQKIAVMYAGTIIEKGLVEEIFESPQHPYTAALLNAVPGLGLQSKQLLTAIPGTPPDLIAPPKGCGFASRCRHAMKVCKDNVPSFSQLSNSHQVACWLQHENAPKVDLLAGLREVL